MSVGLWSLDMRQEVFETLTSLMFRSSTDLYLLCFQPPLDTSIDTRPDSFNCLVLVR